MAGLIVDRTASLPAAEKVAEAMRRSLPHLPAEARAIVRSLLQPSTLVVVTGTLLIWAGSHFVGVGQIVDVILLTIGVLTLGFSVFEGAGALYDFSTGSINARTEPDLERAGRDFARAVTILGVAVVQAVLLRGQAKTVVRRGMPRRVAPLKVGMPPPAGNQLRVVRPKRLATGDLGSTNPYGVITVARDQSLSEQRLTLFHELVHRHFSPEPVPCASCGPRSV